MKIATMSYHSKDDYTAEQISPLLIGLTLSHVLNQQNFLMLVVPFKLTKDSDRLYYVVTIDEETNHLFARIESFTEEEDMFKDLSLYRLAVFHKNEQSTEIINKE